MSDEVSVDEIIDDINTDMSEQGDINDFTSFSDVDLSDDNSESNEDESESKEIEAKSEDDEEDSKSGDKESEKEEKELDLKPKEAKSEDKPESKMLSAKVDGKDQELDPNMTFKSKVDGKEIEVSLQELLNDHSGRKSWNQKFSELGEDKKSFNTEKGQFNSEKQQLISQVDTFVDAVNRSDATASLESLAVLANTNPIELRTHFISLMQEQARAYFQLSESEQKTLDNNAQNKYNEDRTRYLENQISEQQDHAELTSQISSLQRQYGISEEKLVQLHDELQDKSNLSIEALEEVMSNSSFQDKASNLLNQVDPSLANNNGYITEISAFIKQNPDLSEDDLVDSIKEALKESTADTEVKEEKSASSKLQSKINKNKPKKKVSKSYDDGLDDVVDFGDITY